MGEITPVVVSCSRRFTGRDYQVALAMQHAGLLRLFITGIYRKNRTSLLGAAVRIFSSTLQGKLNDRHMDGLDEERILDLPWIEGIGVLGRNLTGRWPGLSATWDALSHRMHDRAAAAVVDHLQPSAELIISFEGVALRTFEAAKRRDALCVLDVGSAHEEFVRLSDGQHPGSRTAPLGRRRAYARIRGERRLADCILVPSKFVHDCLVENGVSDEKILLLPYGYDFVPDIHVTRQRSRVHQKFTVVSVSSINHRKGTEYLLEAWSRCNFVDAELVLVGTPDAYGRDLLNHHNEGVRWVGQIPNKEVSRYLAAADVFALASLAEGSSLAVFEAMAHALPVVVTEKCGSVARNGIDGFIVPACDVDALENALRSLHDDPDMARAMGVRGQTLIREQYSWSHYRQRIASVCQDLLGSQPLQQIQRSVTSS